MSRRPEITNRRPRTLVLALALVLVGVIAIGLAAFVYTGPAIAHPGNSCEPEPGHGTPGCHVTPNTSAVPPATTAVPGDSAPGTTTPPSTGVSPSVLPSTGTGTSPDPNAVQMFVDQNNCLSCHGDPNLKGLITREQPDGTTLALYVDTEGSSNSVHRYKDCTACHTDKPHDVETPLNKLSLSQKCGTCHDYEYQQYKLSVHGVPVGGGNTDPATCTDCHSETSDPHNVVRVLDPSASTYPKNVAQTCAKCHDDPSLMDKYGIVEKVYASYMRSFHGKVIDLAPTDTPARQLDTATCVNCHGAHNITSAYDTSSPVAGMDNLLGTCQSCHPDAGPEFVKGFVGHKAVNSDFLPEVYWGGKLFFVFSRVMLVGGMLIAATSIGLRGVPWIRRKLKRRNSKEG